MTTRLTNLTPDQAREASEAFAGRPDTTVGSTVVTSTVGPAALLEAMEAHRVGLDRTARDWRGRNQACRSVIRRLIKIGAP